MIEARSLSPLVVMTATVSTSKAMAANLTLASKIYAAGTIVKCSTQSSNAVFAKRMVGLTGAVITAKRTVRSSTNIMIQR